MVYVLVTLTANHDEAEALEIYKNRAKEVRDGYGAQVAGRLKVKERLTGNFGDETIRILKFPSEEHVKNWLSDPRYLEVIPYRNKGYKNVTVSILEDMDA